MSKKIKFLFKKVRFNRIKRNKERKDKCIDTKKRERLCATKEKWLYFECRTCICAFSFFSFLNFILLSFSLDRRKVRKKPRRRWKRKWIQWTHTYTYTYKKKGFFMSLFIFFFCAIREEKHLSMEREEKGRMGGTPHSGGKSKKGFRDKISEKKKKEKTILSFRI